MLGRGHSCGDYLKVATCASLRLLFPASLIAGLILPPFLARSVPQTCSVPVRKDQAFFGPLPSWISQRHRTRGNGIVLLLTLNFGTNPSPSSLFRCACLCSCCRNALVTLHSPHATISLSSGTQRRLTLTYVWSLPWEADLGKWDLLPLRVPLPR